MKIDYKILLFENDLDYVNSLIPLLQHYLEDFGFDLVSQVEPDGNRLKEMMEKEDWNLILMDYDLNAGSPKGDELIGKIRDFEFYTEIIFYSDHTDFKDKIVLTLPEGVYFARGREELREKAKKIINLTLKKSQDVNNMRGLVVAETIDIETKMDDLLLNYFGVDDEKKKVFERLLDPDFGVLSAKKKLELINKICKERISSLNKKHNEIPKTQIEAREESGRKIEVLGMLYDEFKKIEDEIIEIRNILSHTKEGEGNTLKSKINKKMTEIIVDDKWCIDTRQNILKHSENLDKIINLI
jgi:CheY-like chemotaxis protein